MNWLMNNWGMIATVLLGVSESMAVAFPSSTKAGGIIAGIVKFLKQLGTKDPLA